MHSSHHHSSAIGVGGGCCGWWVWMKWLLCTLALLAFYLVADKFGSQKVRYHARMMLYYASMLLSGYLAMFSSIPTWFFKMGAMCSWTCLRWICSAWLDVRVEVRGSEKVNSSANRTRSQVLISNHQSSLDVLAMSHLCPWHCCVMVKHTLAYVPFFNIAAFFSNSIFVDRSNKESCHRAVDQASSTLLKNRLKLWVFPEGTCYHEHGMLPFKKGAFNIAVAAQVPIVPVVVSELVPFYSKTQRYFRPRGLIIVEVMDEVVTTGLTTDDVVALSDRVREQMLHVYERISNEARERYGREEIGEERPADTLDDGDKKLQ